ncbi:hypothetical protein A1W9_02971, partial [Escherichia coli KTE89]
VVLHNTGYHTVIIIYSKLTYIRAINQYFSTIWFKRKRTA